MAVDMKFHDVANLFPLIEGQEFDELVEDIRANGLQQPIWTYQGEIIDGRNRYRACKKAGVEPRFQEWDGNGSLVAFAISLNVKRRHLNSSQLSVIALDAEKLFSEETIAKRNSNLRQGDQSPVPQKFGEREEERKEAAKEAAKLLNTNHDYVSTAKRIAREAPELIEHIKEGTLTIPDAKAIAPLPKERRETVVKKAVEKKEEEGKRVSRAVKDAIYEEEFKEKQEIIAKEAKLVVLPKTMEVLHRDFRIDKEAVDRIADNSVDLIFTDPPYHAEHLELWSELSEFAARVLKPGGILLSYSGQIFLPDVLNRLSEHLAYCWLLGIAHTGGHIQIWKHTLWKDWKPIVMFSKGTPTQHDWFMDLYRGDKGDKDAHEWAQGEGEAAYYIEKLTKPGQLVVDPMCGSGTILRAAHKLKRNCIGMEIDESRHAVALSGMKVFA